MKELLQIRSATLTRRDVLKGSGVALGGLAMGGGVLIAGEADAALRGASRDLVCEGACYPPPDEGERQRYSYFQRRLDGLKYYEGEDGEFKYAVYPRLEDDEMRITFMGSLIPPVRRAQQMMSIFVEVGWDELNHRALDSFVFDCGSGVCENYDLQDRQGYTNRHSHILLQAYSR